MRAYGGNDFVSIAEAGGVLDGGTGTDTILVSAQRWSVSLGVGETSFAGVSINLATGQNP